MERGQDHSEAIRKEALAAFERRDWDTAYTRLRSMEELGALEPADEMLLWESALILGELEVAERAAERGVRGFEREGELGDAAIACTLCFRLAGDRNEPAVMMGWLSRAERFAAQAGDHVAVAHVGVARAFIEHLQGNYERALEVATQAEAVAREHGDLGVEALAINRIGRVLIRLGRVQEGQARIDEAMAMVSGGSMAMVPAFIVYCSTIDACSDLEDYRRAGEWTRAATGWCDERDLSRWNGICRIHRAEMWRMHGAWEVAAREVQEVCDVLERANFVAALGGGLREKGLLRLEAGDLEGAEEAFREAHARGANPQPGLARLWLARGKVDAAANALERALEDAGERPLARVKLLPTLVEASLAREDVARAREAVVELEEIAEHFASAGLEARASAARGALQLAEGEACDAVSSLRRAVQQWHALGVPYEVARVRQLLADAYDASDEPDAAALERSAAQLTLSKLGSTLVPGRAGSTPDTSEPAEPPDPTDRGPAGAAQTVDAVGTTVAGAEPMSKATLIDGKLELVRKLGEGGMGTVYLARHKLTGRDVAVKLLRAGTCDDSPHCQRLLQEALLGGQIRHPNVVDVYDAGLHAGAPYLVLEYLAGESVAERLAREGRLEAGDALEILAQALAGVGAAHARGIIHRDLKPDNLFVVDHGDRVTIKVLDFGIAKLDEEGVASPTRTGALVGTPYYMAPEQVEGRRDLDARIDVYAMGVVLYELLTGELPFRADSYGALLLAIMTRPFPSCLELRPELPPGLNRLIQTATARDREQRFADAAAFSAALEAVRGG